MARIGGCEAAVLRDAQLVVSELIASSLSDDRHERGEPLVLVLVREEDHLVIEVQDPDGFASGGVTAGPRSRILDALCDGWQAVDGRVTAWIAL